MQKHTPGPWVIRDLGDQIAWEASGAPYTVATEDGRLIVRGSRQAEETEANARLIAAAPTLLEAAKAAEHALGYVGCLSTVTCCVETPCHVCETLGQLREAIRKAEGAE